MFRFSGIQIHKKTKTITYAVVKSKGWQMISFYLLAIVNKRILCEDNSSSIIWISCQTHYKGIYFPRFPHFFFLLLINRMNTDKLMH